MASFWTDLLASLSNAHTGGRFDIAKAAYGVTPEGRQRRAAQVGLEGAEAGAATQDAGTRKLLGQQLQNYLGRQPNTAALPFEAQRAALEQSQNRFSREMEDVAGLREAGRPLTELGQQEDYRIKSLGLQRDQLREDTRYRDESLKQAMLKMGIDLSQIAPFMGGAQVPDMTEVMGQLFERIGLPRPRTAGGVSDEDRRREAAIRSSIGPRGAPPPQVPSRPFTPPFSGTQTPSESGMFGPPPGFVAPRPSVNYTPPAMIQSTPDTSGMFGPRMSKEAMETLKKRLEQALKRLPDKSK